MKCYTIIPYFCVDVVLIYNVANIYLVLCSVRLEPTEVLRIPLSTKFIIIISFELFLKTGLTAMISLSFTDLY